METSGRGAVRLAKKGKKAGQLDRVRHQPVAGDAAGSDRRVLIAALLFYAAVLATMVASNSYLLVLKGMLVPVLVLAAVLSGRFAVFVNDWAVFLGATLLFDAGRSLVFGLITHFQLPMYADYAIDWERWLCAGAIAPVRLQQWRSQLADPSWLDRVFVLLHASHFLFFLLFGFVLWYSRRYAFRSFVVAMLAVVYTALLIHLVLPTIPPWLASKEFLLIGPIERVIGSIYNVRVPTLVTAFDVNPIAAMPSLHTAMPAMCGLLALRYFGRGGWLVLAYAASIWLAVLYLGEHYLLDVLAGLLLSVAVFAAVCRWGAAADGADSIATPTGLRAIFVQPAAQTHIAARPLLTALAIAALAFGVGNLGASWIGPLPITTAFVQRELVGRSQLDHYLLGRLALDQGDYATAKRELTRALDDLTAPEQQQVIRTFLEQAAYKTRQ